MQLQLEKMEKDFEENRKKLKEKILEYEKINNEKENLREKLTILKKKIDLYSTHRGDPLILEQLKLLKVIYFFLLLKNKSFFFFFSKNKLYCSVCNDREKSCVITRCFHQFCRYIIIYYYYSLFFFFLDIVFKKILKLDQENVQLVVNLLLKMMCMIYFFKYL